MRNLLEGRVRLPARLDAHLRQVHSTKRAQPSVRTHNINASTEKVEDLLQHEHLIGCKVRRELEPAEVRLQQEESLEMWCFEVGLLELDGNALVQASQEDVLVSPDWY